MQEFPASEREVIQELVALLKHRNYDELRKRGAWDPGHETAFTEVLERYGGRLLVPLPDEAFERAELYDVGVDRDARDTNIYLWNEDEGETDVALKLRLWRKGEDIRAEIRDLDVM